MQNWLSQNWGNVVILGVLSLVVAAVVVFKIRARRAGKSTCGCGCAHCAMQGVCHENEEK